jgi:hypothetical protein
MSRNTSGLFQPIIQPTGFYFMAVVNRDTAKDKITKAWFQYGRNQPRTQAL